MPDYKQDGSSDMYKENLRLLEERTVELERINRQLEDEIVERQRAEDLLRASEGRFRIFFEQSPDAIFVEDESGNILDVNPAGCRLHGASYADLVGKNVLDLVPSGIRDDVSRDFPKWFSGELKYYEGLSQTMDGRAVPVEIRSNHINYLGSDAIMLHVRDVSLRRQTEQALRKSEEQLRQAQKMEALGRLAGGVAHDFNNLLTSILGFGHLVLEDLGPNDRMRADVEEILRAGERATDLTRRLLAFGRKQVVHLHAVDINSVVSDVERLLRRTLGEDVELVTQLGENMGSIQADAGQLAQVIMNLAVNARDAMPRGGTLLISTGRATPNGNGHHPSPPIVPPGEYVALTIRDTGCGMTPDVREHIFEPFFTTKDQEQGTGLGLSTVYGIVQQCQGFIETDTTPGEGTEFRVFFPRLDLPAEKPRFKRDEIALPGGKERILIVEDEETVRHLAVRILEGLGYRVLSAANAGEALLICEHERDPIDLILTDVVMPKVSGRELIERLEQIRSDFKVLYMTGFTRDDMVRHGVKGNGTRVIVKPFTRERLAMIVRRILDGKTT